MIQFHVFVACCVYVFAAFAGIGLIGIFLYKLDDPKYRAQLKRKIVHILRKLVKD